MDLRGVVGITLKSTMGSIQKSHFQINQYIIKVPEEDGQDYVKNHV